MFTLVVMLMAQAPDDALLKKLAAHDERMEKYLDGHAVTQQVKVTELDGDGNVAHTVKTVQTVERKNGKLHTTVQRSTRDGKDFLSDAKDDAAKRDEKNEKTESPFAARNQGKYRFTVVGPDTADPTLLHLRIAPKGEASTTVLQGEAVVDPEAGEVVRQSLKPSKNPSFVDSMSMQLEYGAKVPETGRMISRFSLSGAGGLLFIKKAGELVVNFEYAKSP